MSICSGGVDGTPRGMEYPRDMILHTIRRNLPRLGRFHAALFVLLWATMVASPCVMAMQGEVEPIAAHDCPHCPPEPCHETTAPADCDQPDPADRLRSADTSPQLLTLPTDASEVLAPEPTAGPAPPYASAHSRDGPRRHLLHVRFNE